MDGVRRATRGDEAGTDAAEEHGFGRIALDDEADDELRGAGADLVADRECGESPGVVLKIGVVGFGEGDAGGVAHAADLSGANGAGGRSDVRGLTFNNILYLHIFFDYSPHFRTLMQQTASAGAIRATRAAQS